MALFGSIDYSGIGNLLSGLGTIGAGIGSFIGTGKQQTRAYEFNRKLIQMQQDWQEKMSNTAHQREVEDLKAAGLNPVLSAMGGSGATYGSATASGSFPNENPISSAINTALAFRQAKADFENTLQQMSESNSRESLNHAQRLFTGTQEDIAKGQFALNTALNEAQIQEIASRMNLNSALAGKANAEALSTRYGHNYQRWMSDFFDSKLGKAYLGLQMGTNSAKGIGSAITSFLPKMNINTGHSYDSHNYYGNSYAYSQY